MTDHSKDYSDSSFWEKITGLPSSVGQTLLRKALTLYCLMKSDEVSLAMKTAIVAALGYFICPIDAIPDVIPLAGYADDAAVLGLLLSQLDTLVTPRIEAEVDNLMPA